MFGLHSCAAPSLAIRSTCGNRKSGAGTHWTKSDDASPIRPARSDRRRRTFCWNLPGYSAPPAQCSGRRNNVLRAVGDEPTRYMNYNLVPGFSCSANAKRIDRRNCESPDPSVRRTPRERVHRCTHTRISARVARGPEARSFHFAREQASRFPTSAQRARAHTREIEAVSPATLRGTRT